MGNNPNSQSNLFSKYAPFPAAPRRGGEGGDMGGGSRSEGAESGFRRKTTFHFVSTNKKKVLYFA